MITKLYLKFYLEIGLKNNVYLSTMELITSVKKIINWYFCNLPYALFIWKSYLLLNVFISVFTFKIFFKLTWQLWSMWTSVVHCILWCLQMTNAQIVTVIVFLFWICSSECSDGEWSASLPHRFSGTEKDQSSSDESWETLPGKDENEPELQSDSSGPEEENQELSLQEGYVLTVRFIIFMCIVRQWYP